jgi:hypothetical protein
MSPGVREAIAEKQARLTELRETNSPLPPRITRR